jgi:L-asparaginase II
MTSAPEAYVPVAATWRSGVVESVHFGAVVALDRDGRVARSVGSPDVAIYPRSSCKPLQATAMVRAGLRVEPALLALACASHDGTPPHCAGVERLLASVGLSPAALANTPDLPLDDAAAEAVLRAGGGRTPLTQNCSGKHAAMVATCVANGWPYDAGAYLDPRHPLQVAITTAIAELTGDEVFHVGVDGCGAPAHVCTLTGLARAYRRIATGEAGPAGDAVYAAMTAHPALVGGERRDVTALMRSVPGLMAKDGAEGVFAAALPDGRAVALKIADGASRARPPVMIAALGAIGVDTTDAAPEVRQIVRGHGREVGEVRALLAP